MKAVCFSFSAFYCARNLFVKKTNKLEIVLLASIHYTTDVYPPQPAYRPLIYTHLFLFVWIFDYLWEFLLFVTISLNLSCLWEFLLFVTISLNLFFLYESFWISSYLWSSVQISPFYENSFFIHENLFFSWKLFFYLWEVKISKRMNSIIWNRSLIIKTW